MGTQIIKPGDAGFSRRGFITTLASGVFLASAGVSYAEEIVRTPSQTEGPFYPDKLPLDTDNDLLIINDSITPAVGVITYLSGKVMDMRGDPIRNALVEIWQVDGNAVYLHSKSDNGDKRDKNFQGFGRFMTGSTGEYAFRTVKPVPYPGRTAHIHVAVKMKGWSKFTTQCYIKGAPGNATDGVLKDILDAKQKASVIVPFTPILGSKIGELAARFDIVMGHTPHE
ncbi:MAG: protocatechuate 3,4-dioxygenase [Chthonomonadales bacterium]